ncbi:hypothetical protein [Saccharopolyspora rosea]|uniref:Secreted protein n=1 Tax=Saccharopolyspora rosea TaxID=524884 RepID=A0ABW3FQJ6_9PSEU|nr:hypothetical protein [Saccharopolyspora rosea]
MLALASLLAANAMICGDHARAAQRPSPPASVNVVTTSGSHGQDQDNCGDAEHGPTDPHCMASSRDLAAVVPAVVGDDVVTTADTPFAQARRPHSPWCSRPVLPPSGREVLVRSCVSRT